ncbi:efflux RND transporter periplasmic adaptor subunit [Hanstruepera marina]|uniref:efflux RND transporter periplasmic adaptor subunit n=1 Tax=Hanstruepera marina TaxID=2873265 RepID=UPI001CA6C8D7|nr:efflux RND transporter periplasmic adaptor subunit [Hanstruepera marina]
MKKITSIFLTATVLFASCGNDKEESISSSNAPIQVAVSSISDNSNSPFLSVSGKIQAVNSADLSTRHMGYIERVKVKVGDAVKKGELLLMVNNTDLEAKRAQVNAVIAQANVAYKNAEKDYNRFKSLFAKNSATQKEFDDVTTQYNMAAAQLEAAKQQQNEINAQFAYVNIAAPFNGVVTQVNVKSGDMANPGMPLVSVEGPNDFEVIAMVPESNITQVQQGTEVQVLVKSLNKTLQGKVSEVSTSAKHSGGQYLVKIALQEPVMDVRSGMFATVQFPIDRKSTTELVLIPKSALVTNGQLSGVYTVSQTNTALLRWLRLGRDYGELIEVLSGLNASEQYIISAEGKLYNGVKVTAE